MGDARNRFTSRALWLALLVSLIAPLTLTTQTASAAYAKLTWTSPADNMRVIRYDLRVSMTAPSGNDTLGWWNRATVIPMSGRVPGMPGSPDSVLLGGLIMGARYYAVLRSADLRPNWSSFSNVAIFTPTLVTSAPEGEGSPAFVLGAPRPTPTSGRTEVNLELPKASEVDANVWDVQGRIVRRLEQSQLPAGVHVLRWDGTLDNGASAASGVYWVRVTSGKIDKKVKLVLVR